METPERDETHKTLPAFSLTEYGQAESEDSDRNSGKLRVIFA